MRRGSASARSAGSSPSSFDGGLSLMSSLVKIRAERDQMSAIERRIADFILENAHLLRDYSSQQLANSLAHQPVERGEVQPEAGVQGLSRSQGVRQRGGGARERQRRDARGRAVAQRSASRAGCEICGAARRSPRRRRASSIRPRRSRRSRARIDAAGKVFVHRARRGWHSGARVRGETGAAGHSDRASAMPIRC